MQDPTPSDSGVGELVESDRVDSIESSRQLAVQRVFRGGIALSLALGLMIATEASLFGRIPMIYAAMVLGGLGAVQMGRAREHLIRFGSKTSLLGFTALAGSGVSFAVGVTLNFSRNMMGVPVPQWLLNGLSVSANGLAVVVVLVALKTIASWVLGSFGASDAQGEAPDTI